MKDRSRSVLNADNHYSFWAENSKKAKGNPINIISNISIIKYATVAIDIMKTKAFKIYL